MERKVEVDKKNGEFTMVVELARRFKASALLVHDVGFTAFR
jgi:hypothetical protein